MKKNLNAAYSLKLKNIILSLNRDFFFFKWSYSQRCFDVENDNVVSTLSNVQFNVEKHNVVSKLFNVANFNFAVHNVVSTLI